MKDLFIDAPEKVRAFKFDLEAPYRKYYGFSQGDADPTKAQWRIYRITIVGTVFTQEFANFGKYIGVWDNRASYFSAPPSDPGTIPTDDFINISSMPEIDVEPTPGVAMDASIQDLIAAVGLGAKQTTLQSVLTALASVPIYRTATATPVSPGVNVATTSVVIAPANPNRKGFYIYNNSGNSAYINFGPTAVGATPVAIIATYTSFVMVGPICYTGVLSAIRNTGSGVMTVTELI